MKEEIKTALAPMPGGHFSQGIKVNNRIYVAGQVPINAETGKMPNTIEEQTRQALINIKHVLAAAGASLEHVVKVNTYLTDLDDFDKYNEVYKEFFKEPLPVRTTCGCQLKGIPIEIDAIAELDDE
ncbi:endoribonuclease [Shouchella clausii]|uniref:RidA family protein n=1 Tax=Shouchella tritolerans TaxID=2979466 RepID=UPI000786A6CE|nr:RidA family protein [Shouchella tritolerans]GIN12715.1 endoribonuclease [Shouchella clausii]